MEHVHKVCVLAASLHVSSGITLSRSSSSVPQQSCGSTAATPLILDGSKPWKPTALALRYFGPNFGAMRLAQLGDLEGPEGESQTKLSQLPSGNFT